MTRGCVVDASVGVKLFLPEELSENATELFREITGVRKRFFVPDLFYAECANIFWKSVRRLVIPSDEAQDSLQDLKGLSLLPVATSGLLAGLSTWRWSLALPRTTRPMPPSLKTFLFLSSQRTKS